MWHTINEINLENYICSLEQVGEYSEECYADTEPSAPSSLKNTQEKSCCNGSETESCQSFQSGTMLENLTANHGAEKSMSSAEGFPARTFHAQEKEQGSTANEAECGEKWRELLVKYDRNTHSWKTHLCLWEEDLQESLVTLPKWGIMQDGVCWEPLMLAHRTKETESGFLLPTPTCADATMGAILNENTKLITLKSGKLRKISNQGVSGSIGLARTVAMWPTPTCHNAKEQDSPSEANRNTPSLCHLARGGDKTQPRHLNPEWVEWLMGWPIGWTDLKPLETDKCHNVQHSHGIL